MKSKCFNRRIVCAIGAGLALLLPVAHTAELEGGMAQGVRIAEYNATDVSPVVRIYADRIFEGYEQHGFFYIGLLPIPVAENVKIQISSAECLTNALLGLQEWCKPSAGTRRLELRNLEIAIIGETQPRLTSSRARIGNDSTLELFDVSSFDAEGRPVSIRKGELQIAGGSAGCLSWKLAGRTEEIFPLKTKAKVP